MRNDRNVLHEKQHELHSLVGRTPCSYGQNRKEQVVLIRCRTSHSRLTHSYLNGMYSMKFQLFTKTYVNRLRRCDWYSSDILQCQHYIWYIYKYRRRHNFFDIFKKKLTIVRLWWYISSLLALVLVYLAVEFSYLNR
jgi:hypothetical protein